MFANLNKFKLTIGLVLLGSVLWADQIAVTEFGYLNTNENSTIISAKESQDLLNCDVTPGGKSVKKRSGNGLYKTVFTPSTGIHGGYHFFDSAGNDIQLWGSSTSLKGIVADGTPNTIVSSATTNATWDCADTQGFAYCVDSSRDAFIKTNGTVLTNWYTTPLGTMVEATPDRVVVAGVAASPNTLFVSQSNTFTNFVTGVNATDAFTEVIASPGSHLTHERWGCQRILWWKDQSFGYFDFDDQYTAQVKIVSDTIGTLDNTSAIDPGGAVWFRGQDGHTYMYDCSGLTRETVDITPQIQTSGRRTSNLWQQTTQAEFQTGAVVTTNNLSTTLSPNDVVVSTFATTFYLTPSSYTFNAQTINNYSFDAGQASGWTASGTWSNVASAVRTCGTINPQDGTKFESFPQISINARVVNGITGVLISSIAVTGGTECSWALQTITLPTPIAGTPAAIVFDNAFYYLWSDTFTLNGNSVQFYANFGHVSGPTISYVFIDNITSSPKASSATFTSSSFDLTFTSSIVQLQAAWTPTAATGAFNMVSSTATTGTTTGAFGSVQTSSGTSAWSNRYVRVVSSLTWTTPGIISTTGTLVAASSGTYYSAWKNAPNFTAWSTFNPTTQDNGGSHTFYVRASTSPQIVLNSTVTWVSQTANAQVATSTAGIYFQVRDDFSITAATANPVLSDFTVNWFEGSATDQAYMLYFDNAIWESVAYGVGVSSNNYIFRRDLINDGWGLYSFGANGMLIQGNKLYWGSVSDGNVYQYGSGTSDNGSAINSYWKSKDFTGADPFLQSQLTQIDTFAKKNQSNNLTVTYSLDTSTTTTSYTIPLSSATAAFIQSRKLLPSGKLGYTFNIQYGDNTTTSAWELFGFRIGHVQQPYKPSQ